MRLLAPLTLTTRTLTRAARGGAGLVMHVTKGVAGHVRPQTHEREAARFQPAQPTTTPAAPPAPPAAATAPSPPATPAPAAPAEAMDPTAPDQPEFAPPHMDEEAAEVVYSSADAGAEDGAGPTIHVDEPWDAYRAMAAADVIDRLALADTAMLAAVQLYETSHKSRPSILKAVELRLEAAARA